MELLTIRGGLKEDLLQKKYNIGVGVSLGNKWFTVKNIVELAKWSLALTRDTVVIYVADSIHGINLEVRKRISNEKAVALTTKMGSKLLSDVKSEIEKQLLREDAARIKYVQWSGLYDESYCKKVSYLYSEYESNESFRETIQQVVKNYTSKDRRSFSAAEINRLSMYILEELPECIGRVQIGGTVCDAYAYPFDGELTRLIEKIQLGEIFSEIKNSVLDTEPKVFLEVR